MTHDARYFRDRTKALILEKLQSVATENGVSRDRSFDQYRYHAGKCAGLSEAVALLDETFKKLTQEDDE